MYHQAEWTGRPPVESLCLWNGYVLVTAHVPVSVLGVVLVLVAVVALVPVPVLEPEYRDTPGIGVAPVPRAPAGTRSARNLILFYCVPSLFMP